MLRRMGGFDSDQVADFRLQISVIRFQVPECRKEKDRGLFVIQKADKAQPLLIASSFAMTEGYVKNKESS